MCISSTSYLPRSRVPLGPTYIVTGLRQDGRRFKLTTTNRFYAFGINLWRGHIWQITETGRRVCLKKVIN